MKYLITFLLLSLSTTTFSQDYLIVFENSNNNSYLVLEANYPTFTRTNRYSLDMGNLSKSYQHAVTSCYMYMLQDVGKKSIDRPVHLHVFGTDIYIDNLDAGHFTWELTFANRHYVGRSWVSMVSIVKSYMINYFYGKPLM